MSNVRFCWVCMCACVRVRCRGVVCPWQNLNIIMEKSKGILANTSRSVMAKKFKINDGASKYVETATLLEPANNNSASQNEKDEIREVS